MVNSRETDPGLFPARNVTQCCSGFCIDLLEKFSDDLGFTYELIRVDDPKFGTHVVTYKFHSMVRLLRV
jgi:ionotropic glutamate receptor NMDA 2B